VSALNILEKLGGVEASSLTQLQRVLIVTDGTLTEILEAAFLERIRLVKISQEIVSFTTPHAHVDYAQGEAFLERKILLQGTKSTKNYVYAESVIAINRLPPRFHEELVRSDTPLGQLWLEHRLETFKELLEVRLERAGERGKHFNCDASGMLLARTYRVSSAAVPVITITECFPVE
jgi:chorismate-pyruvate lyase